MPTIVPRKSPVPAPAAGKTGTEMLPYPARGSPIPVTSSLGYLHSARSHTLNKQVAGDTEDTIL